MVDKEVWVGVNVRKQRPTQLDKKEQLSVWALNWKVRESFSSELKYFFYV